MWEILRDTRLAAIGAAAIAMMSTEAQAQDTFINQNISGFNLPGVQLPQGHDEVRAADGTTCRSAVSGSGAYIDLGLIGNPEQSTVEASYSAYGRVVIPLGKKTERLDCSRLYDLEVERLSMELQLMQLGLNRGISPVSSDSTEDGEGNQAIAEGPTKDGKPIEVASNKESDWTEDGWNTDGLTE